MSEATAMTAPKLTGTGERGISRKAAVAMGEMQAFVYLAQNNPRDEDLATAEIIDAAVELGKEKLGDNYEGVEYVFPRGNKSVRGPSVYFAREAARLWHHIHYGIDIQEEDEDQVLAEAYAWDLVTGTRPRVSFIVEKKIQRKDERGNTRWVKPDTRELRELVSNIGARNVRDCILQVLPRTVINQAVAAARDAAIEGLQADPQAKLKELIDAFAALGVTKADLKAYLGHPVTVRRLTGDELTDLRGIYKALRDKQVRWSDYVKPAAAETGSVDLGAMFKKTESQAQTSAKGGEEAPATIAGASSPTGPEPAGEVPEDLKKLREQQTQQALASEQAGRLFK